MGQRYLEMSENLVWCRVSRTLSAGYLHIDKKLDMIAEVPLQKILSERGSILSSYEIVSFTLLKRRSYSSDIGKIANRSKTVFSYV